MTQKQFDQLCAIIRSGWNYNRFLDNGDIAASLFNSLNRFPFQVCKDAIISMIENDECDGSTLTNTISAGKIIHKVEAEYSHQREQSVESMFRNGARCPVCMDEGYTLRTYPTGVQTMTPCSCAAGRYKFPWYFQTAAERKEWEESERKRGQSPRKAYRCKQETCREAYYGPDPEKQSGKEVMNRAEGNLSAWIEKLQSVRAKSFERSRREAAQVRSECRT